MRRVLPLLLLPAAAASPADRRFDAVWRAEWQWRVAEHLADDDDGVDAHLPGQTLSYYLGELTIQRACAKAEAALGPTFDIRAFHDTVLSTGSVPLPVLKARVDRFIAAGGKSPYPAD